jgi:hypothetical protein
MVLKRNLFTAIRFTIGAILLGIVTYYAENAQAQSLAQEFGEETISTESSQLIVEKIVRIGPSKRIFILTNENGALRKGDFFSILLDGQLAVRCLVAKNKDNLIGMKAMKIYSLKLFELLRPGMKVQILRGDDSYFYNQQKKPEEKKVERIEDEDDLYLMDDGTALDENNNRIIKPDNIIGAAYSQLLATDVGEVETAFTFMNYHWAYQMADNVWFQFNYANTTLNDFPNGGMDSTVNAYTFRLKYTIEAPFYSYVMPYIGYRVQTVDSPDAGQDDSGTIAQSVLAAEEDAVNDLERQQLVVGATILRRLVPGWFATVDLGTDGWNIGLALEF